MIQKDEQRSFSAFGSRPPWNFSSARLRRSLVRPWWTVGGYTGYAGSRLREVRLVEVRLKADAFVPRRGGSLNMKMKSNGVCHQEGLGSQVLPGSKSAMQTVRITAAGDSASFDGLLGDSEHGMLLNL